MADAKTKDAAKGRPPEKARQATREMGYVDTYAVGITDGASLTGDVPYGTALIRELWEMSLTDETVGAMLWCISTVMSQVDWKHVPQVDGKDDEVDAKAKEAADFADTMLVDMDHTMQEHVDEACSMIIFGFAPCEIVLKQRNGGEDSAFDDKLYGIKKLPLRDQVSITEWVYDGNDAIAFRQMAMTGSATIPLWKTLHYRTASRLDKPMGRPLLLNALRPWKLKIKIQDAEAIGIDRDLCGLPVFSVPEEVLDASRETDADGNPTAEARLAMAKVQNAIKAVRDMRFNRTGGMVKPSDTFWADTASDTGGGGDRTAKWQFELVTTAGQRSIDTRTAARDYDRAIARIAMMQFLHLGDRSTGSYALSEDQSSLAVRSLMALATRIAGEWRRKVLKLVWQVNRMDVRYMPRLRASEISKDGIAQIGALMAGMGKSTGLWESDVEMRMALAKLLNLPANREAQTAAAESAAEKAKTDAMPKPEPAPFGGARPANSNAQRKAAALAAAAAMADDDDEEDDD